MKHTVVALAALLLAPMAALRAADVSSRQPPQHLGVPKAEHAVTNRAFTGIPSLTITAEPWPTAELAVLPGTGWRGVYFNPQLADTTNFPWLLHYDAHRALVRRSLSELREDAGINLVDVQVLIAHSLRVPARGNRVGERVEQWASVAFLDNIARFVDDCHAARLAVELDLADNRWLPSTVDPDGHIGKPGRRASHFRNT